jgi:hypothetical protein
MMGGKECGRLTVRLGRAYFQVMMRSSAGSRVKCLNIGDLSLGSTSNFSWTCGVEEVMIAA